MANRFRCRPETYPLRPEFRAIFLRAEELLQPILGTRNRVLFFASSGTRLSLPAPVGGSMGWMRGGLERTSCFRWCMTNLKRVARRYLRRERSSHTLRPTALVNAHGTTLCDK